MIFRDELEKLCVQEMPSQYSAEKSGVKWPHVIGRKPIRAGVK
jgi:hypothetical protein